MASLTRRIFLGGGTALVLAPTAPAPAAPALDMPAVSLGREATTVVAEKPAPWWGWSYDDDLFQGPFASREAALADARDNGWNADEGFTTALCHPRTLRHPDYEEVIVEWLYGARPSLPLDVALREAFEGGNEEHDFEGEVAEEAAFANWAFLAAELMPLLEAAVGRSGFFLAAPVTAGMFDGTEAILDVLQADEIFARDLRRAATAWSDGNGLLSASRRVDLTDEQSMPAAVPT